MGSLNRLNARAERLERPAHQDKPPGLLVLPPILPVDAWEAIAVPHQVALARDTRQGVDEAPHARITTELAPALDAPWWQGQQQ